MNIGMKIKNINSFTIATFLFILILLVAPVLNIIYNISYIDMPVILLFTVGAFVMYTVFFMAHVYLNGVRR